MHSSKIWQTSLCKSNGANNFPNRYPALKFGRLIYMLNGAKISQTGIRLQNLADRTFLHVLSGEWREGGFSHPRVSQGSW